MISRKTSEESVEHSKGEKLRSCVWRTSQKQGHVQRRVLRIPGGHWRRRVVGDRHCHRRNVKYATVYVERSSGRLLPAAAAGAAAEPRAVGDVG